MSGRGALNGHRGIRREAGRGGGGDDAAQDSAPASAGSAPKAKVAMKIADTPAQAASEAPQKNSMKVVVEGPKGSGGGGGGGRGGGGKKGKKASQGKGGKANGGGSDAAVEAGGKKGGRGGGNTGKAAKANNSNGNGSSNPAPKKAANGAVQRSKLPILLKKDEFLRKLKAERLAVVVVGTGSGKTTQLPQYLAADAFFTGRIICTQPRALAAVCVADRVSREYEGKRCADGKAIGYEVSGGRRQGGERVTFMTEDALIKKACADKDLRHTSCVIIDEAHERNCNTDVILGICKAIRTRRDDFYVVVSSATIDPTEYLEHFDAQDTPGSYLVELETTPKPITVRNETLSAAASSDADASSALDYSAADYARLGERIVREMRESYKHTLVFLPGQREIAAAMRAARCCKGWQDNYVACPLYGGLDPEEQEAVMNFDAQHDTPPFSPDDDEAQWSNEAKNRYRTRVKRMVVFSTNIAETSLTVPNVRLIVDTGLAKEARYDPVRRTTVLELSVISRASADQRRGRVGRIESGTCVRLYKETAVTRATVLPEIQRSSLDLVCLRLTCLGLNPLPGAPDAFPYLPQSCPAEAPVREALQMLHDFGCLAQAGGGGGGGGVGNRDDDVGKVTKKGHFFLELGCDPRLARLVCHAHSRGCLEMSVVTVCVLSAPGSIYFMGGGQAVKKEGARATLAKRSVNHQSDLLMSVAVFKDWRKQRMAARVKHAMEESLNNKSLTAVEKEVQQMMKVFFNAERKGGILDKVAKGSHNEMDVLAEGLMLADPNRLCETIDASHPGKGAHLVNDNTRAHIERTSALFNLGKSEGKITHFIAMGVTSAPTTGHIYLGGLHPIDAATVHAHVSPALRDKLLGFRLVFERADIGSHLGGLFQRDSAHWADRIFVDASYDKTTRTVVVYGPEHEADMLKATCHSLISSKSEELERATVPIKMLPGVTVTIGDKGLRVIDAKVTSATHLVPLRRGSALATLPGGKREAYVRRHGLSVGLMLESVQKMRCTQLAYDTAGHADAARKKLGDDANEQVSVHIPQSHRIAVEFRCSSREEACCAVDKADPNTQHEVAVQLDPSVKMQFRNLSILQAEQLVAKVDRKNSGIRGRVLYKEYMTQEQRAMIYAAPGEVETVRQLLPGSWEAAASTATPTLTSETVAGSYAVRFTNVGEAARFHNALTAARTSASKITGRSDLRLALLLCRFERATFMEEAEEAKYRVEKKFPNLDVSLRCKHASDGWLTMRGDPHQCSAAVRFAADLTKPNTVDVGHDLRVILDELGDAGLAQLAGGSGVEVSLDRGKLLVRGSDCDFGTFTAHLGRLHNDLVMRVKTIPLTLQQASLYRHTDEHKQIEKGYKKERAAIQLRGQELRVYSRSQTATAEMMRKIFAFADKVACSAASVDANTRCVSCQGPVKAADRHCELTLCGHRVCVPCQSALTACCPVQDCWGKVVSRDVRKGLAERMLRTYLTDAATVTDVGLCPTPNCKGILSKTSMFHVCPHCYEEVCARCQTTDRRHARHQQCSDYTSFLASVVDCPECGADVDMRRGYHTCGSCYTRVCGACDTTSATHDSFSTCEEYKDFLLHAIRACPSCRKSMDERRGYHACLFCGVRGCGKCNTTSSLHASRTCAQYQDDRQYMASCPRSRCGAHLDTRDKYHTCHGCGHKVCAGCGVYDVRLHEGMPCENYAELKKSEVQQLYRMAEDFCDAEKEKGTLPPYAFHPNPCVEDHPAYERCRAGLLFFEKGKGMPASENGGLFGWHGTPTEEGLANICCGGWDTTKRSGQAYGPGEYFAVNSGVSMGYANRGTGKDRLILVYILKGSWFTCRTHYVVNNPLDHSCAYVLPVGVVCLNNAQPPAFIPRIARKVVATSRTAACCEERQAAKTVSWEWNEDGGKARDWVAYADDVVSAVERAYVLFKRGVGLQRVDVTATSHKTDRPQNYVVDFALMKQINSDTQYQRRIRRCVLSQLAATMLFEFEDSTGQWTQYDFAVQAEIEHAWTLYKANPSTHSRTYRLYFAGRPEEYEIDFRVPMFQKNLNTNKQSKVRCSTLK